MCAHSCEDMEKALADVAHVRDDLSARIWELRLLDDRLRDLQSSLYAIEQKCE